MTDRELLEKAANAAGYKLHRHLIEKRAQSFPDAIALALGGEHAQTWWNPLDDDGDAMRLAVKLRLDVAFDPSDFAVGSQWSTDHDKSACERLDADPYAATRRAIVRAAAEMAK